MSCSSRCQLTTKNFSFLQEVFERGVHNDDAYRRLLRQKLSSATVLFEDDMRPDVAMINSRVEFTIDRSQTDHRILAYGGDYALPDFALSVTTLRGLALLGLTAGETIMIERPDGGSEEVRLDTVTHPREVIGKAPLKPPMQTRAAPDSRSSVIAFEARHKAMPAGSCELPIDPDDLDPGPQAA